MTKENYFSDLIGDMRREKKQILTQFTVHSRLHLLGLHIANHMQHGKKYVVGAYANPPKKPKSPLKNGKVIAITIVKPT
jgi:hypothetical protein